LGVSKITVHSTGGKKMIGAAKQDAVNESENLKIKPPDIFAVTILTSLDDIDLHDIGYRGRYLETVENLAELAISGGADGIVCSPNEVTSLREKLGGDFFIATPGIRMTDNCSGDQKRFNTPFFAIKNGADYIIAGRPVTENADPESAVETILEDINKAL
jgi:orotidine-5'-phosphate decarboxylase